MHNSKVDPFNGADVEVLLRNPRHNTLVIAGLMTDFGITIAATKLE